MKVKVTLKNGIETILNDVRVIKPLVNEPQVIIVYKDVCQFEYIDDKRKLQMIKWYIYTRCAYLNVVQTCSLPI